MTSALDRYLTRLSDGKRPKPFAASDDDVAQISTAIELAAYRADRTRPTEAFVSCLRKRLAAEQSRVLIPQPAAAVSARRRRFVRAGLIGAAAFGTGLVTEPLLLRGTRTGGARGAPEEPEEEVRPVHGTWHKVATSAQLPEGAVMDFDLGSMAGYLHRSSGRLRAVSATCTHQACRLGLDAARSMLVCPCHGAAFTLAGAPQPASGYRAPGSLPPLPRIPVRERLGNIEVYAPGPHSPAEA